jgi:hypothetical protein
VANKNQDYSNPFNRLVERVLAAIIFTKVIDKRFNIAKAYSNLSYAFPNQSTLPIIAQNRVPNLPIPSLPVVLSRMYIIPLFFFRHGKLGNPLSAVKNLNEKRIIG